MHNKEHKEPPRKLNFNFIWAEDKKGGIGKDGKLPWHMPADMKRFKELTTGSVVIMGSKTFASLNYKPLPNRKNVILTSRVELTQLINSKNPSFKQYENAIAFKNIPDLMNWLLHDCDNIEEALTPVGDYYRTVYDINVFVIGGTSVYEEFLSIADVGDKIYRTIIHRDFDCDTYAPRFDKDEWELIEKTQHEKDKDNKYNYEFEIWEKK